ncbi:galactose oxidase [Gigaspora margarita]|uniref:Galactose oxidase n=1 Tax=Gigaspora margarita TaxID=4874 RepID=A0A8H4ANG4_GIGMA|nr:galactose oxidase [Gigaspora margarita]
MNFFHVFFILNLILIFANCQNIPDSRFEQTGVLVNEKIYFFGGILQNTSHNNEVWYLDFSKSFNITSPSWHKDVELPIKYDFGTSCGSRIDNFTVFLIGGRMSPINYSSSGLVFNSKISQWSILNATGFNSSFASRIAIQSIIDDYGKIFIFGGRTQGQSIWFNDMNVLDITTMTWTTLFQPQDITKSVEYAAVLSNNQIIYIGGRINSGKSLIDMNNIRIFDTKSFSWSIKNASGDNISARLGHSAVLTQNGDIIIYGGAENSTASATTFVSSPQVIPLIAILNTNTWIWSNPNISQTNAPPSLAFHSSVLYKKLFDCCIW